MPRNGAGTYTLPAGNPVVTNTTITAAWGNDTMEDLGNEITNSLSREGDGGMNAPLRFVDGTQAVPGIGWVSETSSGFYWAGPGEYWAAVLGIGVLQFTDNGLLIPTGIDLTVQGGVSFEGALNVIGNFSVATNKFTVAAASGNTTVAGTFAASGAGTFTSASATSLAVGLTGATNPAFTVDSSTASQVAGLKVTGAATAGTVAVAVTDSGSNASLTVNAKGSGTIGIGSVSTGAVTITPATTITGVATLTAQPVLSSLTASKPVFTDASKGLVSTGTLAYDQGGTGQTTYAAGDIVYASATNTLSKLAVGTTGQVLKVAAGVPSWATDTTTGTVTSVGLSAPAFLTVGGSPVTTTGTLALTYSGTALPEANGGTAQTTYTTGDLLYASGANTLAKLAVGTTGQVLKVAAGVPSWDTDSAGSGTVTSVDLSGGTTGLTTSGGPITTSGTITLAGTLAPGNGGTGVANNAASTLTISGAYATTLTVTAATGVTLPTTGTLATLAGTETLTNKTLTSPTLTTPALGTPASGNLSSCTADGTDQVGFKNIPQNSQSAAYTLVLADAGKHIFHPSGDANARTYTIPANSSVAYPIGTAVTFINMTSQVVTIAITTDTMYLSSAGTTGSRSLAQYGSATAIKMTSTTWLISGSGLT
jgi:hypothetical protein